ncbi:MAG: hypothetical protein LBV67_06495 [Streptococcaceae bacterium]|jgi:accessory Sec system glycosyltransferase GtfB|nr:hypothetical protein [Streptococcaceae bacterium]
MIGLFENFDTNTKTLLTSLKRAFIQPTNVFIRYKGELPQNALSPFTHYMNLEESNHKALFFNEVKLPDYYEIKHKTNEYAEIFNGDERVGKIHYKAKTFREVEKLSWQVLEKVVKEELYNVHGKHYATTDYHENTPYMTTYFKEKQEVIYENHQTGLITLLQKNKKYQFENLTKFTQYYLDEMKLSEDTFIINSLSYPLFVLRTRAKTSNTILFWQEKMGDNIPGNMSGELENPIALKQIIFDNEAYVEKIRNTYPQTKININYLSSLHQFVRKNQGRKRVFNLTALDQFIGLEEVLQHFPEIEFVIAAKTTMSDKLLSLENKFTNIQLIPNITTKEIIHELAQADIYLDLNLGTQVSDIIDAAFRNDMLVLGLKETAKENWRTIVLDNIEELITTINSFYESSEEREKLLNQLHSLTGPKSTIADYQALLK